MDKKEKGLLSVLAIILIVIIAAVIVVSVADGKSKEQAYTAQEPNNISQNVNQTSANQTQITVDDAKNTALKDAGFNDASVVVFTSEKLDYDNGRQVYEIDFHDAQTEYEYDIDSSTGEIVSRSQEPLDFD
ncbi:MAG: PepSY domain-containing protein [Eubacteriales bacterium]|nr:PepSY domain-containing protein [Eubacteriales bacterium]